MDFGSVGLCHVAAGFTDAMVEFAKGFAIWDLVPGAPIPLDYRLGPVEEITRAMSGRRRFVAAATVEAAREILGALDI